MKFLYLILFILIVSCSAKNEAAKIEATGALNGLPEWVLNPEVEGGIAAVGTAQKSRGGIPFQIKKAEADARGNIANKILSQVSRITKQALRESNVNGINDVEDVFSQATKEVVKDIPLSGIKRINMYSSNDGTLYVHMVLKNDDYSSYIANSRKMYEESLKNANLGRGNLNKSQEAVKELFDELEKERNK